MNNPTLKRGSSLHDDNERLQLAMAELGHPVDIDGHFGPGLEREVRAFQASSGLPSDGVVDAATWRALAARSHYGRPLEVDVSPLTGFRGDIGWIHRWEGHAGRPYWPGGASGVTLDPGLDLGHAPLALVEEAFGSRLSAIEMGAIRRVSANGDQPGKRGDAAKAALDADPILQTIRVLRTTATEVLPMIAKPYWATLCRRFETLGGPSTPGAVQTAMLSLGYNRGAGNRALGELTEPLARGDWLAAADSIGAMQQEHQLPGIRKRRRAEAELIRSSLR
ncbi:MAG: peptidoglycan-binding protein [Acidobacteriota bacterium]